MPLAGLRPAWIVARTFTRPRSAMRRIVQSPTEGSANEGNHGRLVVTPATRLGGEVQPAAPAFQAAPAPAPGVRPCARQVPLCRRREAVRARRDLRSVHPRCGGAR